MKQKPGRHDGRAFKNIPSYLSLGRLLRFRRLLLAFHLGFTAFTFNRFIVLFTHMVFTLLQRFFCLEAI